MASTFYITAGLTAIDNADSPPSGDNKFFITAGLVANDYTAFPISLSPSSSSNSNITGTTGLIQEHMLSIIVKIRDFFTGFFKWQYITAYK